MLSSRIIAIDSIDDPRVADYRNVRDKDLLRERGAFIAESEVVCRVLVTLPQHTIRSFFIAEPRLGKIEDALAASPPAVPIYVASKKVLDAVVGFHIHRGVLASVERPKDQGIGAILRPHSQKTSRTSRIVLLEATTNHDNVGGIFRNAAAFGADAVLFDRATCDPLYRKAVRVSVGGSLLVPNARLETSAEVIAAARHAGYQVWALSPRSDSVSLEQACAEIPARVALLLGTEGEGLRTESMDSADRVVRISIEPNFDSLNVAVSSAVALHAVRQAQHALDLTPA